jgi:hypothetical protein
VTVRDQLFKGLVGLTSHDAAAEVSRAMATANATAATQAGQDEAARDMVLSAPLCQTSWHGTEGTLAKQGDATAVELEPSDLARDAVFALWAAGLLVSRVREETHEERRRQ